MVGTEHDLGAVGPEQCLLLDRLLVRHHEDAAIALERGGDGQAVAGVARGRLDDRPAGLEQAGPLGRLDHREADAVLDRAARVEHLELREEERLPVLGPEVAGHPPDADERRVPDEVEDGLGEGHPGEYREARLNTEAPGPMARALMRAAGVFTGGSEWLAR